MEPSLALFLNRRYRRPHRRFVVTTDDGVAIHGVHLGGKGEVVLIYCHGLFSSKNYRRVPLFVEGLAEAFDAVAFDFRGHGDSAGKCTFGRREVLDLRAVVEYARVQGYTTIVPIGASMGGATALRYFGQYGDLQGIATIGAFSDTQRLRRAPTRLILRLVFDTPVGPALARLIRGTRVGNLRATEQPLDFAEELHVPLLVIHGEWDTYVELDHGRHLVERAPGPKKLVIIPRGGHVTPLLNDKTRRIIVDWMRDVVLAHTVDSFSWQMADSG